MQLCNLHMLASAGTSSKVVQVTKILTFISWNIVLLVYATGAN
jgi:hypothetical protein